MKKICYSLILLTSIIFPINVFATSGISVDTTSITVGLGDTKTFTITAENAIGDVSITSNNTAVVSTDVTSWETGTVGEGETKSGTITVAGVSVGTTTLTLVVDGAIFDDEATPIKETKTINVIVVEKSEEYTVTYDANGGEGAPSVQNKEVDKDLTLSSTKPTREEYEFINWNTQKDGKGTSYDAGGKYTKNADLTLYAQWKQTGNVGENPDTGDTLIYVILLLTLGALIYSYWYMKKVQEN